MKNIPLKELLANTQYQNKNLINSLKYKTSFAGVNIKNKKIDSLKIYFTLPVESFYEIFYPFFKERVDVARDSSWHIEQPGIGIKFTAKNTAIAFYYSQTPGILLCKEVDIQTNKVIGRKYLLKKQVNIPEIIKKYKILISSKEVKNIEFCQGIGIRNQQQVSYKKVSIIPFDLKTFNTELHNKYNKSVPTFLLSYKWIGFSKDTEDYISLYLKLNNDRSLDKSVFDLYALCFD